MTTTGRGFQRMSVDDRRLLLLEQGRLLFTTHAYDELSMATIAREAGISKALLYHYFPSKQAYFVATLQDAATELAERIRPDDGAPPRAQLESALDTWLGWIDDNGETYSKLMRSAHGVAEVRDLVDGVRDAHRGDDRPSAWPTAPPPTRPCATPPAAGCGSWTASAWTGSATATCRATTSGRCCSTRSRARSPPPAARSWRTYSSA